MNNNVKVLKGKDVIEPFAKAIVDFIACGIELHTSRLINKKVKPGYDGDITLLYTRPDGITTADPTELVRYVLDKYGKHYIKPGGQIMLSQITNEIEQIDLDIFYD